MSLCGLIWGAGSRWSLPIARLPRLAAQEFEPHDMFIWDKTHFPRYSLGQFVRYDHRVQRHQNEIRMRYAQAFAVRQMKSKWLKGHRMNVLPNLLLSQNHRRTLNFLK